MTTPTLPHTPSGHWCKRHVHLWTSPHDAAKCCNGYRRELVYGGGVNQIECAGVMVGRRWVKEVGT